MNSLSQGFLRVAERALNAAEAAMKDIDAVHEKAGFLAYHAFESAGGAYCSSRSVAYHPASHPQKISRFVNACKQERFALQVAALAIEVASLRNLLLYPKLLNSGAVCLPENLITKEQAKRLLPRIRRLTEKVRRVI